MSNRYAFIPGTTLSSSLTRFHEIVVGEASSNGENTQVVMRSYGTINSTAFQTNPGGAILFNQTLTNLALPINPLDAVNKEYVDSIAIGLNILAPVAVATTTNITLSGLQTIDGYTTITGDRVLVKNQTDGINNGLYNASSGAWTRTSDLPNGSDAARVAVNVQNGSTQANSTWVCTNSSPNDIVGTDSLVFTLFISNLIPGAGLSQSGNTLNVNVDNVGIEINGSNELAIVPGGITNADLQNSSITLNTSNGIQGGGTVSLGGSLNLSVDSTVVRTFGLQTIGGSKLFTSPIYLMSSPSFVNGISIASPASLSPSYALTLPTDTGTSGQFLTTDGTGTLSWTTGGGSSSTSLLYAYGPASSASLTNTFTTVILTNSSIADVNYTNTSGSIEISTSGVYEVSYWAQFQTLDNTGGEYSSFGCQILQNASVVSGSIAQCFLIESTGALLNTGCGKDILVSVAPTDTIALQVAQTTGTTTAKTVQNQCTLTIKFLR